MRKIRQLLGLMLSLLLVTSLSMPVSARISDSSSSS